MGQPSFFGGRSGAMDDSDTGYALCAMSCAIQRNIDHSRPATPKQNEDD